MSFNFFWFCISSCLFKENIFQMAAFCPTSSIAPVSFVALCCMAQYAINVANNLTYWFKNQHRTPQWQQFKYYGRAQSHAKVNKLRLLFNFYYRSLPFVLSSTTCPVFLHVQGTFITLFKSTPIMYTYISNLEKYANYLKCKLLLGETFLLR